MIKKTVDTYSVQIFVSGPIEVAKQIIREECLREGLCVTIEPTTFIYTGGEELGYVATLRQYPRFPVPEVDLYSRAVYLAQKLIHDTFQQSAMLVTPTTTTWFTNREQ